MKLFGLRLRSWLFLGIGFLAGSAVGKGPFERVMQMVDELRGGGGSEFGGQSPPGMNQAANDLREAVSGINR
jgi:hypothetical protein